MNTLIQELKLTLRSHEELNPKLWNGKKLDPEVWRALDKIAKEWAKFAKIPNKAIKDIIITGGNANYNYTDLSDIDLHLVVDKDNIPCDGLVDEYLQSKKQLWSLTHDVRVKGQPVELYAQPYQDPFRKGQGIYSIQSHKWLQEPTKYEIDRNHPEVTRKVKEYMNLIDTLIDSNSDDVAEFRKLKGRLKGMRTGAIQRGGESAPENLVFKEPRNRGYLDKMNDYMRNIQDQMLSLEAVEDWSDEQKVKYHKDLDKDSDFYQQQRREEKKRKLMLKKPSYRIDPDRDEREAKKRKKNK